MRPLTTLLSIAFLTLGSVAADAQSYTYSNVRKDFVYADGFGVPHSKTVSQQGVVQINADDVLIDGVVFKRNEKCVYKNARGKAVDLSFEYQGKKLVAVRMSKGHIINSYILDEAPAQNAVVQR